MKKSTRFPMLLAALFACVVLCACNNDARNDAAKAVGSIIDIRIAANDFDGAMEVLSNCDKSSFEEGELDNYHSKIVESAKEYVSRQIDEIIEENGYKEAYEYLENSIPSVLEGDGLSEEKTRIRELMVRDIVESAEQVADMGNYTDAIAMLRGIGDSNSDEKIPQIISEYKQRYANDTIQAVDSGELDNEQMLALLDKTYDVTEDAGILERLKQFSRPKNLQALESMKHRFTLMHDEQVNAYTLKSKLFDMFVTNAANTRGGMVSSALSECNGVVTFFLVLAYSTDELLEPQEIIFNCDGVVYSFSIEDTQREEKVIDLDNDLEICGIFDSLTSERHTLTRLLEVLVKAESVTVTAKGKNRDMDFDFPNGHIRELLLVWDVYNILKENPELFDEVFLGEIAEIKNPS